MLSGILCDQVGFGMRETAILPACQGVLVLKHRSWMLPHLAPAALLHHLIVARELHAPPVSGISRDSKPNPKKYNGPVTARKSLVLAITWGMAIVAILPVVFRWEPPAPAAGWSLAARTAIGYGFALLIAYCIYRVESVRLAGREAVLLVSFLVVLTAIANQTHYRFVDHGANYFQDQSNTEWQVALHARVMRLDTGVLPHSFRFLPNAVVRWMEFAGLDYERARDVYRTLAGLVLFYALYRFARFFTTHGGAMTAVALVAMVIPVSYEYYAGQLTDPLSHLSFVLAFTFLETGDFGYLLTTILIGALAKESVLAMAAYYALFCGNDRRHWRKAIALGAASAAIYLGVRSWVLRGVMQYNQVSGTNLRFIWSNFREGHWVQVSILTIGAFSPFLVLDWKEAPSSLKRLVLYLVPVLVLSSLLFSWLRESRNYMPVVFVMAVIAARHLAGAGKVSGTAQ
jgi:hypothetical protein